MSIVKKSPLNSPSLSLSTESSSSGYPSGGEDFFDYDYCESFYFSRNVSYIDIKQYRKIFTIPLTNNNVISYGPFFFFMIEINKIYDPSTNSLVFDSINTDDESIDLQVDRQLNERQKVLCKNTISNKYLKDSIKNADFKFFMSAKSDTSGAGTRRPEGKMLNCPIIAFRLLKDFSSGERTIPVYPPYLDNFNIIESLLVCAIEISRTDQSKTLAKELTFKAGFGAVLTYKTVQFAIDLKYQFYFIRTASTSLIYVYRKWGFHLGIPFLNLDYILKDFHNFISVGNETQRGKTLYNIIQEQIKLKFQSNFRLCKSILGIVKGDWEDIMSSHGKDAFDLEAKFIADYIYDDKSETFSMYLDITKNSSDIEDLYNYSFNRFNKYISYNDFYKTLINDDFND